ncbi:MAG: pyruvate, phosphate dikinase, partial [Candidatus Omnitrophica bacterium]|nr:pyruvate, phosphate dikinase [Candidatus Omnitrophota bacterium]
METTKRTRTAARNNRTAGRTKPTLIYTFGGGRADGRADMKQLLGGKGANLAEMTNLGVPVPPGVTITTEVCRKFYELGSRWPNGLQPELRQKMSWLESVAKKGFGDPKNPLLVSVRSGAAVSMPGMMDTILNLGLNEETVRGLIAKTDNPRFAYDAYRRFIQMYSHVVLELDHKTFEDKLAFAKARAKVATDAELPAEALKQLVAEYKQLIRAAGKEFPEDPMEQLRGAVNAVFNSWNNERAIIYRRLNSISGLGGTAVNIQAMVFGNMGPTSLTGVCFTRDPGTGSNEFYGEYLVNAQGEDVVAGIRTPKPVVEMKQEFPKIYDQLYRIGKHLEKYFKDVQDVEFTVEDGILYMLQCRTGKRTAAAAVGIVTDFVREGLITRDAALLRIDPAQLDQLLHPTVDPKAKPKVIAKGLPASPGAAVGKVVFEAHRAVELTEEASERVILVRQETSPEDIEGMAAAQGILTARGGQTSHAAVVARGMGKCCVVGCSDITVREEDRVFKAGDLLVKEGDYITLNGTTGEVILGEVPLVEPQLTGSFKQLLQWADQTRRLGVRANADTPKDAQI